MFIIFLKLFLNFVAVSFAHGEDKLGPHGGFVRMPGVFHTELVPDGKDKIKIFLLDINWQSPSTNNSSVAVKLGKKKLKCAKVETNYQCSLPKGSFVDKKGKLSVEAKREGQSGVIVFYDLPLKLDSVQDHSGH